MCVCVWGDIGGSDICFRKRWPNEQLELIMPDKHRFSGQLLLCFFKLKRVCDQRCVQQPVCDPYITWWWQGRHPQRMSSRSTSDRHQQVKGGRKEEVRPPSFFHPLSFLCFPLPLSASLPPHSPSPLSLSLSLLHGDSDTAEILHLSHTLDESYASQTPSISQKFLFFLSSCFFFLPGKTKSNQTREFLSTDVRIDGTGQSVFFKTSWFWCSRHTLTTVIHMRAHTHTGCQSAASQRGKFSLYGLAMSIIHLLALLLGHDPVLRFKRRLPLHHPRCVQVSVKMAVWLEHCWSYVTGHTSGGCTVNHNCKSVDPQTEAEIIDHLLLIG